MHVGEKISRHLKNLQSKGGCDRTLSVVLRKNPSMKSKQSLLYQKSRNDAFWWYQSSIKSQATRSKRAWSLWESWFMIYKKQGLFPLKVVFLMQHNKLKCFRTFSEPFFVCICRKSHKGSTDSNLQIVYF